MTTTLPTLTGSDKQVSWASQIRDTALAALATYEAEEIRSRETWIARKGAEPAAVAAARDAAFARIVEARTRISAATSAAAIIDQRLILASIRSYCTYPTLPKALVAALPLPA